MSTPFRRLELWFWSALPAFITLALAIFSLTSKHIAGLEYFMPALPLIPIFYWGMMHAREMPYWFVFTLGMVTDSIIGLPLGLSSLLYMFFLALLHAQRKYIHKEGFVVKWLYFAMLLAVTEIFNWLFISFFSGGRPAAITPAFLQWLLTICCYPLLHKSFDLLDSHIHARRWQLLHGS